MNMDSLKEEFVNKYTKDGGDKFYKFVLLIGISRIIYVEKEAPIGVFPNLELLDIYEQFIILYRREGDPIYLEIAKVFRKVAHKIYRIMLKKNMTNKNMKFLNMV